MSDLKRENLKLKVVIGFGSATILIIIALFTAYSSFRDLMSSINYLAKPEEKISKLNTILTDIVGTENSMRAYALSKDKEFLKEYKKHFKSVEVSIDSLKDLTSHNAFNSVKVNTIARLWEEKKKDLNNLVELYNKRSLDAFSSTTFHDLTQLPSDTSHKIVTNTIKTTITTPNLGTAVPPSEIPQKEKEGIFASFKKIFNKKTENEKIQIPIAELPGETKTIVDSNITTISKSDSTIQKLVRKLSRIKKEELVLAKQASKSELKLLHKNKLILDNITNIIIELRREELISSSRNVKRAKQVADKSTDIIAGIAILGLLSTVVFVTLIFRDITKSNYYKNRLLNSKKEAEKLAKAKEDFLANMSHEIRTPLNSIIGFTEQLQKSSISSKHQHFLEAVSNSSEHLLSIVNDILDYSKLESGKLKFEKIPFSVDNIVQEVIAALSLTAKEKNIELKFNTDNRISHLLIGDTLRLKQILFNLLSNAIKFTDHGEVKVFSKCEYLPGYKFSKVMIEVADSGIGISKDNLEKIFDSFTQADEGTTRKYGGTGLGLAISKSLIELQGGKLFVRSQVNKGSTFTFEINYPVCSTLEIEAQKSIADIPTGLLKDKRIMVVEDDELNILLLHTILKKYGAMVSTANNGEEGLELLQNNHYDLILTDMNMPMMNGIDFLKKIRNFIDPVKAKTPLILITANVLKEQLTKYLEKGINNYILKPFKEEILISKAAEVLGLQIHSSIIKDCIPQLSEAHKEEALFSLKEINKFSDNDPKTLYTLLSVLIKNTNSDLMLLHSYIDLKDLKRMHEIAHKMISTFSHLQVISVVEGLRNLEAAIERKKQEQEIIDIATSIVSNGKYVLSKVEEEMEEILLVEKLS